MAAEGCVAGLAVGDGCGGATGRDSPGNGSLAAAHSFTAGSGRVGAPTWTISRRPARTIRGRPASSCGGSIRRSSGSDSNAAAIAAISRFADTPARRLRSWIRRRSAGANRRSFFTEKRRREAAAADTHRILQNGSADAFRSRIRRIHAETGQSHLFVWLDQWTSSRTRCARWSADQSEPLIQDALLYRRTYRLQGGVLLRPESNLSTWAYGLPSGWYGFIRMHALDLRLRRAGWNFARSQDPRLRLRRHWWYLKNRKFHSNFQISV